MTEHKMTAEELRKFPEFESITDEEVPMALKTIESLARILYYLYENDLSQGEEKEQNGDRI